MFPSRGILPAIVTAVAAMLPVVASASNDAPAIRVVYGDLNLATPAGLDELYSRIRSAAARYCEAERIVTGTRINAGYDRCIKETVAMTVQKVNVKGLSTLHADRTGAAGQG
jgi:UrcA family protein